MSSKSNQLDYHDKLYTWEEAAGEFNQTIRYWMRHGKTLKDADLIRRLDRRLDRHRQRESEANESFLGLKLPKPTKKNRHGKAIPTETTQDKHGLLWLFDHEATNGEHPFYWKLRMHRTGSKKLGVVKVEIRTSKGHVTHLHDKKTMTAFLRKISSTFERAYGKKALQDAIYPTSGVNS